MADIDMNRVSVVFESNQGGFPVTICACGVLCFAQMAQIHAQSCEVFIAEADRYRQASDGKQ